MPAQFDFTRSMRSLCEEIASCVPALWYVDMSRVLISITHSRNANRHGLQARMTPLRFRGGSVWRQNGAYEERVERIAFDGREMLYLLTFSLPRFLEQSTEQKLITIVHELYHISPGFDGDLRRFPGRCQFHDDSKEQYDAHMRDLAREYLRSEVGGANAEILHSRYRDLVDRYGGVCGIQIPRPKIARIRESVTQTDERVDGR